MFPRHIYRAIVLTVLTIAAAAAGCSSNAKSRQPDGTFYFPLTMAVHPSQKYAYIVSSNFDLGYTLGTLKVVDLVKLENMIQADLGGTGCNGHKCSDNYYTDAILEQSTLQIGNFGGQVLLNSAGTRLFVAQRQDNVVSWADISPDGSTLDCVGSTIENPDDNPTAFLGSCHRSHYFKTGYNDPFDMALGPNPVNAAEGCIYVGHLREGVITCIAPDAPSPTVRGIVYKPDFSLGLPTTGVNDIEFSSAGRMFVANRSVFGDKNLLGAGDPPALLNNPTNGWMFDITDVAGMGQQKSLAVTADGSTIYLLIQGPDALLRFNIFPGVYGTPEIQAVDYLPVGVDPSRLFMLETTSPARRLLYIPCVDGDYVHVVDGNTMEQAALLDWGFDGPYWMAFYDSANGKRALISNFESSQITVISIDPLTMSHGFLAAVGAPRMIEAGGY
jgi:hypothetical protein